MPADLASGALGIKTVAGAGTNMSLQVCLFMMTCVMMGLPWDESTTAGLTSSWRVMMYPARSLIPSSTTSPVSGWASQPLHVWWWRTPWWGSGQRRCVCARLQQNPVMVPFCLRFCLCLGFQGLVELEWCGNAIWGSAVVQCTLPIHTRLPSDQCACIFQSIPFPHSICMHTGICNPCLPASSLMHYSQGAAMRCLITPTTSSHEVDFMAEGADAVVPALQGEGWQVRRITQHRIVKA